MRLRLAPVLLGLLMAFDSASAEWVQGKGEWVFGPNISENEACELALRKARKEAIRKVTGERLSSEELLICKEHKDAADCDLNRLTWSTMDGVIQDIRNKERNVVRASSKFPKCTISLEADVKGPSGEGPDPGFDMTVRLNSTTFRHGEPLVISVEPTQPMFISVFQWLPYENSDRQVRSIFPNEYDTVNRFQGAGTIPTKYGGSKYSMWIGFPEGLDGKKKLADEYLMVIGTRNPLTFRQTYSFDELKGRLLEIPRRDRREVRKLYNVVRPN